MTKKDLIELLKDFEDKDEIVVPSPCEPGRAGVAITRVKRQRNGKVKLCCLQNEEREMDLEI